MVALPVLEGFSIAQNSNLLVTRYVMLQQVSNCGSEGWGFESLQAHSPK